MNPSPFDPIRKNLLDLYYQRTLQHHTTLIALIVTYLISSVIALASGQIDYQEPLALGFFTLVTFFILGILTLLLFRLDKQLSRTIIEIRKLSEPTRS